MHMYIVLDPFEKSEQILYHTCTCTYTCSSTMHKGNSTCILLTKYVGMSAPIYMYFTPVFFGGTFGNVCNLYWRFVIDILFLSRVLH